MKKTRSEIFGHAGKRTEVCFCLTCTFWKSFSGHSASRGVHEGGWQRPLAFVCVTGRRWNFAAVCCVSQQMRMCSCSGAAAQKVIFLIEMYCLLLYSWVKMAFSLGVSKAWATSPNFVKQRTLSQVLRNRFTLTKTRQRNGCNSGIVS